MNHANKIPALIATKIDGRRGRWVTGPRYNLIDKVLTPDKLQDATGEAEIRKHTAKHACSAAGAGQARCSVTVHKSPRPVT